MEFRKKPVVIEAIQYEDTLDCRNQLLRWANEKRRPREYGLWLTHYTAHKRMIVETLEGRMELSPHDWLIKGVKGEFYPCKPDIFEMTYEPVVPTNDPGETGTVCPCGGRVYAFRNKDKECNECKNHWNGDHVDSKHCGYCESPGCVDGHIEKEPAS